MSLYTVTLYTPQELNHSSYIQTGLFELEKLGYINVKIKLLTAKRKGQIWISEEGKAQYTKQAFQKVSYYKLIDHSNNRTIKFATDLYDFATHFSEFALKNCHFYFKRNFESKYVDAIPRSFQGKIYSLGMTFGTHSEYERNKLLFFLGLVLSNLRIQFKLDRYLIKRLFKTYKTQIKHWQFIRTTRLISRFESYNRPDENTILFQTRCFLHENTPDLFAIHQQRYHIIKLLRTHFPNNFKGGFIPSRMVSQKYKDALSDIPAEPNAYLDVLKRAGIVIYTRGLANSPAWKMAEYLSQGKVIIAERPTTEFPIPLEHGKELLYFENDEELLEVINRVLKDPDLFDSLSANARAYFETNVHPVQNTKRILEIMTGKPLTKW